MRPPCHLSENMKDTGTFKSKHLHEVHKINKKYNCNSKMEVYLIECQIYGEQYNGSTKRKFRSRANNCKSMQRKFVNTKAVPKRALKPKRFHVNCDSDRHNDIEDLFFTLIDNKGSLTINVLYFLYTFHVFVFLIVFCFFFFSLIFLVFI